MLTHLEATPKEIRAAKKLEPRACDNCVAHFVPTRPWQRFCSPVCRAEWHASGESLRARLATAEKELVTLRAEVARLRGEPT